MTIPLPASQIEGLQLLPAKTSRACWGTASRVTQDGAAIAVVSSLANGEMQRGVLRSAFFTCGSEYSFWLAGHSHAGGNRVQLKHAQTHEVLVEQATPGTDIAQRFTWNVVPWNSQPVYFELVDDDAGDGFAWLAFGGLEPSPVELPDVPGAALPSDWKESPLPAEEIIVDGIPFARWDLFGMGEDGGSDRLTFPAVRADYLHLLGGANSIDLAHASWGGTQVEQNFFLGDQVGELVLGYDNGVVDRLPLVIGFNVFFRNPYLKSPEPFASDPHWRGHLEAALHLANAADPSSPAPWHLRLALRDTSLAWVQLVDSMARHGHPVFDAATFAGVRQAPGSERFAPVAFAQAPERVSWFESHTIAPEDGVPAAAREAIRSIADHFYTHESDIEEEAIRGVPLEWDETNFEGPKVELMGGPEALLLERIYYHNAEDMFGRVDDETGMVHESAFKADRYDGFAGWTPGVGAYYDTAYTRLRLLSLLPDFGRIEKSEAAIAFFDKWMMYFPESYPDLQLGGKPVPGHATVIANQPHIYFDVLRHHGWPTKFTTRDFGNPENDGHGMLMISRYRTWAKAGRTSDWIHQRWAALEEAADYIAWSLENPELSFSEHGVLYNESEAGLGGPSYFCDIACQMGLLAYAEMADTIGRDDKAAEWRATERRLREAGENLYPYEQDGFGEIWHPGYGGLFFHGSLAAAVLPMDYYGFDVMNRLPSGWRERTERTFRYRLTKNHPSGASSGGMAYGPNFIAQTALLLDEMEEAEWIVNWIARACYAPRLDHPFRVPEHFILREGAQTWRRWGDLGNLVQLGETIYTLRLMIGIDDIRPEHLLLMPRALPSWQRMASRENPVRVTSEGESKMATVDYEWVREEDAIRFQVKASHPIDVAKVRLGPFAKERPSVRVLLDGEPVQADSFPSGDGRWVWLTVGGKQAFIVEAAAAPMQQDNR